MHRRSSDPSEQRTNIHRALGVLWRPWCSVGRGGAWRWNGGHGLEFDGVVQGWDLVQIVGHKNGSFVHSLKELFRSIEALCYVAGGWMREWEDARMRE